MLFADVRGSTPLAEKMSAAEFGRLMNRFYEAATHVLVQADAFIDNLVGDEVTALFVPALLARSTPATRWTPGRRCCGPQATRSRVVLGAVGVGIHTGRAGSGQSPERLGRGQFHRVG